MEVLSIDIGGTSLKYATFKNGKMITEEKSKDSYQIDVNKLVDKIYEIYTEMSPVDGLAIASPGAIEQNSIVNNWTAIEGLSQGVNFSDKLKKAGINVPIKMVNDVNAAAFGEWKFGGNAQFNNFVFIAIGSGIGGGCVINQKIVTGNRGFAGEFGNAFRTWSKEQNVYQSPQDNGGFYGLAARWKSRTGENKKGIEIFDLFDKGDKYAKELIEDFYEAIIATLFLICHTFDPEMVVLGGGLAKRSKAIAEIKTRFLDKLKKEGTNVTDLLNIKKTKMANKAPLYGAYAYFIEQIEGGK